TRLYGFFVFFVCPFYGFKGELGGLCIFSFAFFFFLMNGRFPLFHIVRNVFVVWMYRRLFDIHFFLVGESFSFVKKNTFHVSVIMDISLEWMLLDCQNFNKTSFPAVFHDFTDI